VETREKEAEMEENESSMGLYINWVRWDLWKSGREGRFKVGSTKQVKKHVLKLSNVKEKIHRLKLLLFSFMHKDIREKYEDIQEFYNFFQFLEKINKQNCELLLRWAQGHNQEDTHLCTILAWITLVWYMDDMCKVFDV
jgi:hypothetical protein